MSGKGSTFLVFGFSIIFLVVQNNFNSLSTRSVDNLTDYYLETTAHNIAVSGANMAANQIFFDANWNEGYDDVPYQGGEFDVSVQKNLDEIKVTSIGEFEGTSKKIEIILRPSSFAKYAYYMNIFPGNMFLYTGDTIWGPFHTQGKLNTEGSPVFFGKATSKLGLKKDRNGDPKFYGGYESGVNVPFELDPSIMIEAGRNGGALFEDATGGNPMDVKLEFSDDGTVTYRTRPTGDEDWGSPTTELLSTLAPNGVIFNEKGNMYVSGTVAGKYTVGTGLSSGNGHGNVFIEDDIVYRTNPLEDEDCEDLLGIVASNNVVISDNAANKNDININATIFNYKGGITVEGLENTSANMGKMNIIGGLIEYQAQITGYTNNAGYRQLIKYDPRLMLETPPFFPATRSYEVVSWYE